MKRCFKCGTEKPRSEFYRHSAMGDGLLGKCKDCTRADSLLHRKNNLGMVRHYDRTRGRLPHRRALNTLGTKRFRKQFPDRYKAHSAVSNALRDGTLKKLECAVCRCPITEAHHEDYSRPLEVIWLCKPHHCQADAARRERESCRQRKIA